MAEKTRMLQNLALMRAEAQADAARDRNIMMHNMTEIQEAMQRQIAMQNSEALIAAQEHKKALAAAIKAAGQRVRMVQSRRIPTAAAAEIPKTALRSATPKRTPRSKSKSRKPSPTRKVSSGPTAAGTVVSGGRGRRGWTS